MTCIERAAQQLTALDAAGYAIVTLCCDSEEDIRRVVRRYVHADTRDAFPIGGEPGREGRPRNIREVNGCGQVIPMDAVRWENALPLAEYLALRQGVQARKAFELLYIPDAAAALGSEESAAGKTPDQLEILRLIRALSAQKARGENRSLIVIGCTNGRLCKALSRDMYVLDIPYPDKDELTDILQSACEACVGDKITGLAPMLADDLAEALRGMREDDVRRLVSMAYVQSPRPLENDGSILLDAARDMKRQKLAGIRGLEWLEPEKRGVGGMDTLVHWIELRRNAFLHPYEARVMHAGMLKGILLVGLPGCGKTHLAKCAARLMAGEDKTPLPLLRLDFNEMLSKWQSESEGNLRVALRMLEAVAPCVVLVDEIEKEFDHVTSDTAQESTRHFFSDFLQWQQQDREKPVIVIAAANRVDRLPRELKRKGRFDEVFSVGLPTLGDLRNILGIQLRAHAAVWAFPADGPEAAALIDQFFRRAARLRRYLNGADLDAIVRAALSRLFAKLTPEEIRQETAGGRLYTQEELQAALMEELDSTRSYFDHDLFQAAVYWLEMRQSRYLDARAGDPGSGGGCLDPDAYSEETGCFSDVSNAPKPAAYLRELEAAESLAAEQEDYDRAFRCALEREIWRAARKAG